MAVKLQLYQMKIKNVFSSCYLPPILYFMYWQADNESIIDVNEYFVKQTYRSRCTILGANGKLDLIIPVLNRNSKQLMKDVKISDKDKWKINHWKSIESAYRKSPYFEFYEEDFSVVYLQKKHKYLIDFNNDLMSLLLKLLKLPIEIQFSENYVELSPIINDLRTEISPKNNKIDELIQQEYIQVFSDKIGFQKNLSIIDLLFNEGPNSKNYLQKLP